MDDFNFWWYILAAVIYFLTRRKKKQPQKGSAPNTENTPQKNQRPKSFEELLQEITGGNQPELPKQEPVEIKTEKKQLSEDEKAIQGEEEERVFTDDESRHVYEESVRMAEKADSPFGRDDHFKEPRLFQEKDDNKKSYFEELMDGFDTDEAKRAVIYSEILNKKY
ncbi:MAG: hypothetical protein OXH57_11110 [Ekhidna sp.]|nr:hypothetical protein [Ekhidna sp.]